MPVAVTLRSSALSAKREHFSDAAADDGRKVLGSHLGISVIKLTPKEKDGREREERGRAGRDGGQGERACPLLVASRRVVTSLAAAHSFIPTFLLARSLAR